MNLTIAGLLTLSVASFAAEAAPEALVPAEGRSPWSFSAGPSWRSRVKMETRGTIAAAPLTTGFSSTYLGDSQNPTAAEWATVKKVDTPAKYEAPDDDESYAIDIVRRDITTVAGADYTVDHSEKDSPLGLNLQTSYDFCQGDTWSLGVNFHFAAYWDMDSSTTGSYNGGYRLTQDYNDSFLFMNGPFVWLGDDAPTADSGYLPEETADYSELSKSTTERFGSRSVTTHLRADLYQFGLGPKATWSPCSWLDVYGSAEILCNIAREKLTADGDSKSKTDCLLGFGLNVGANVYLTESMGLYGQIGYEWIDTSKVSVNGFESKIDYSSLVLSAGIQVAF